VELKSIWTWSKNSPFG